MGHHFGMDCRIIDELIAMAEHDRKVGDELAASGALYEGYDPRMAAVHEKNALRLREIMAQIGWPTERLVGKRAADAAWLTDEIQLPAETTTRRVDPRSALATS